MAWIWGVALAVLVGLCVAVTLGLRGKIVIRRVPKGEPRWQAPRVTFGEDAEDEAKRKGAPDSE